jgi:hypothetical protein
MSELISGGHCRAFAPTWTKLARDKQHLERLAGFHMAQVNCLAQGGKSPLIDRRLTTDLCNSNGIKFCKSIEPHFYSKTNDRSSDNLIQRRSTDPIFWWKDIRETRRIHRDPFLRIRTYAITHGSIRIRRWFRITYETQPRGTSNGGRREGIGCIHEARAGPCWFLRTLVFTVSHHLENSGRELMIVVKSSDRVRSFVSCCNKDWW